MEMNEAMRNKLKNSTKEVHIKFSLDKKFKETIRNAIKEVEVLSEEEKKKNN